MKQKANNKGFSIIEMTLASFLVLSIAAVSYRVLNSQTTKQISEIQNQKADSISQLASSRFKADASMIDPNWVRYGVAPIYPHQGYGLGQNYYLLSASDRQLEPDVNDGVTFLRRDPKVGRLYVPVGNNSRLCYPNGTISSDATLYGSSFFVDSIQGLNIGDWMLVYQAGHYALGVISSVNANQTTVSSASTSSAVGSSASSSAAAAKETSGSSSSSATYSAPNNDRYVTNSGSGLNAVSSADGSDPTSLVSVSQGTIQLRMPNAAEAQAVSMNTGGYSSGFVTKPGVVVASFDVSGVGTSDTTDNSYCFDSSKTNLQKVSPVSYYIDYRTSNNQTKSVLNSFVTDQKSKEHVKMLIRSEYVNGVEKREYLAPAETLGFTYDILNKDGIGSDRIARDVGRSNSSSYLQNLNYNPQAVSSFLTAYQIVAMKMSLATEVKDASKPGSEWKQNHDIKVALDPTLQKDAYRDSMSVVSSLTDNLSIKPGEDGKSVTNQQMGKPFYLANSSGSEVIVPVSRFEVMTDGTMGSNSNGALYVYDPDGCAVNSSGCKSNQHSAIQFDVGINAKFFPNTISQATLADGTRRILVGGIAMSNDGKGNVTRTSGLGIITLGPTESLADKLNAGGGTATCNISNCAWHAIDKDSGDSGELVDTAHLAVNPANPDKLYVATMTKKSGETSMSAVFQGTWNGQDYMYEKFANVVGTEQGKVISAISDHPIRIGNEDYLAVCLTKKMSSSCGGECITGVLPEKIGDTNPAPSLGGGTGGTKGGGLTDSGSSSATNLADTLGEIQLVKYGSGTTSPGITLIRHNYRCSSINVDSNSNLIVSGRLTVQPISYSDVKKAVEYTKLIAKGGDYAAKAAELLKNNILYLDEAVSVESAHTIYADYYQVDPTTYKDTPHGTQYIGWLTGSSTLEMQDGTFGIVNGNMYRLAPGYGANTDKTGSAQDFANAGIARVSLAGMNDRVVATIQTDPNNINNSIISATYAERANELPSVYIPGSFWINSKAPRSTPTPLPAVTPSMSEVSWMQLYQSLLKPVDSSGLNSNMPTLSDQYSKVDITCKQTHPKTCT